MMGAYGRSTPRRRPDQCGVADRVIQADDTIMSDQVRYVQDPNLPYSAAEL
jgi:hypothetical protein